MKRLLLLFVLCILWISCSDGAIKIVGKIQGSHDRVTLKLSPINSGNRQSISSADADANGSFVLTAPAGWYALWVTVEYQQALKLPIYLDKEDIEVNFQLATNDKNTLIISSLDFDQDHAFLSKLAEISIGYKNMHAGFLDAYAKHNKNNGGIVGLDYDFSGYQNELLDLMEEEQALCVRQFAAVHLPPLLPFLNVVSGTSNTPRTLSAAVFERAVELVPLKSPLWGLEFEEPLAELVGYHLPTSRQRDWLQGLYEENPVKLVKAGALLALTKLAFNDGEQAAYETNYGMLAEEYQSEVLGAGMYWQSEYIRLDPTNHLAPGKPVPDFEVSLIGSGETVSKQSLLGKYYLMDFWATWCGPCLKEMANLHAMHEKFKDKNFTILSLSIDESVEDIAKFRAAKWPMPWMHTLIEGGDQGSAYSEIGRKFRDGGRLWSIPKPILVSPQGEILATYFSLMGDNLEPTLNKFLNQADATGTSD